MRFVYLITFFVPLVVQNSIYASSEYSYQSSSRFGLNLGAERVKYKESDFVLAMIGLSNVSMTSNSFGYQIDYQIFPTLQGQLAMHSFRFGWRRYILLSEQDDQFTGPHYTIQRFSRLRYHLSFGPLYREILLIERASRLIGIWFDTGFDIVPWRFINPASDNSFTISLMTSAQIMLGSTGDSMRSMNGLLGISWHH